MGGVPSLRFRGGIPGPGGGGSQVQGGFPGPGGGGVPSLSRGKIF